MVRICDGDRVAFELLYDRFGRAGMRFLHRLSQDRALAEDLTQETFLAVWRAAPRWRPTGRVSTWIFQIAKRQWWNRGARRQMRRPRELEAFSRSRPDAARPDDPGRGAELDDEVRRLRAALGRLSPKLRLVFVLVRLEGLSYADAAEVAGLRLGTLKSRMAAAEAWLRHRLGENT